MLGQGGWEKTTYNLQTIKDNLNLSTPESLDEINQIMVKAGRELGKKSIEMGKHGLQTKKNNPCGLVQPLRTIYDSFVIETNEHYPTDINLPFDAIRKTIEECIKLTRRYLVAGWRQYSFNIWQLKAVPYRTEFCQLNCEK